MFAELPFSNVVSDAILAADLGRSSAPRSHARDLLPRLLRVVDGAVVIFGVMNLVWVAALALFVLAEKFLPVGPLVGVAAGVVSALIGLVMVVGVRLPA